MTSRHRRYTGQRLSQARMLPPWSCHRLWRAAPVFRDSPIKWEMLLARNSCRRAATYCWRLSGGAEPDVVIIEAFPFGRRQMRFELLRAARCHCRSQTQAETLHLVRDILQQQKKPGRDEETVALLRDHFDGVLVPWRSGLRSAGGDVSADFGHIRQDNLYRTCRGCPCRRNRWRPSTSSFPPAAVRGAT